MNFGKYHNLVEEVIEFSKTLKPINSVNVSSFTQIINDQEKAEYLAYEEVYGEDEYTWKDIREIEMSEVWERFYELEDNQKPEDIDALLDIFSESIRHASTEFKTFFEDIVADLNNCAINRAINGNTNNFFEKVFEIYKAGYFPCGWNGDYPNGTFVVFKKG
ncbi:hypothetical protein [Bacillus stercoris]|uniref:hypothetical protein n=1 Tax=Bacillus stercoris TaxID=2054641 RepID=UPI00083FE963|nr:hypothetical protein [Bacillus stercoris]MCB7154727.1 hypothetical protein [Bacillus stercoris]MEC2112177.1 hypothetical protein [Bacillus stercoris]MEC3615415.1 hypothetical protein [Bacillus stercoris]OEI75986.1 hypothetical protein BG616_18015 [Bacillus subtilis]